MQRQLSYSANLRRSHHETRNWVRINRWNSEFSLSAAETAKELETYIVVLEMKRLSRPSRITSLLQELESCCSAEYRANLETYIAQLEYDMLIALPYNKQGSHFDLQNPPRWSHQRSVEREERR